MKGYELLVELQNCIAQDDALVAWCKDTYGKPPSVWIAMDDEDAPSQDDYPVVEIVALEESSGETKSEKQFTVYLGIGVVQKEITESTLANGAKIKTHKGMLEAEQMRELVRDAVFKAKIMSVDNEGESATRSFFPLFVSYQTLTFKALITTRRALPAT